MNVLKIVMKIPFINLNIMEDAMKIVQMDFYMMKIK